MAVVGTARGDISKKKSAQVLKLALFAVVLASVSRGPL